MLLFHLQAKVDSSQRAMKILVYDGAKDLPITIPLTCRKYFWSNVLRVS